MSMWGESIVAKINPKMVFSYYSRFCPILRYWVSGVSAAAGRKAASLILKETREKRISNNECRMSKGCILPVVSLCCRTVYFKKD